MNIHRKLEILISLFLNSALQRSWNDPTRLGKWGGIHVCVVASLALLTHFQSKVSWSGKSSPISNLQKPQIILIKVAFLTRKALPQHIMVRSLLHEKKRVNTVIDEIVPKFETIVQLSPWIFWKVRIIPYICSVWISFISLLILNVIYDDVRC
jgi:hypothetical protein